MEQNHRVFAQIVNNFVEVAASVVDNGPTATPARDTVNLAQSTRANDWSLLIKITERDKGTLLIVAETVVDLIGNYGNLEFIADLQDFFHVLLAPARAARVTRIVHKDCLSFTGNDSGTKRLKLDFPTAFGVQVVVIPLDTKVFADGLA